MLQQYCSDIASVGDGNPHKAKVNTTKVKECDHCGKPGHTEKDCWKKHPEKAPDAEKGKKQRRPFCRKCKKKGHKTEDCPVGLTDSDSESSEGEVESKERQLNNETIGRTGGEKLKKGEKITTAMIGSVLKSLREGTY